MLLQSDKLYTYPFCTKGGKDIVNNILVKETIDWFDVSFQIWSLNCIMIEWYRIIIVANIIIIINGCIGFAGLPKVPTFGKPAKPIHPLV